MNVNFGLPFMTVDVDDLDEWCRKYELEVMEIKCRRCGSTRMMDKPFFTKYRRGLYADECTCGDKSTPFSYIDFRFEC